ncbi:hypothetical protein JCM11641_002238 [Rhodosporidiobolus odoratus]
MPNTTLHFNAPPQGEPVPGETLKRVVDEAFDPETVDIKGGILVKCKALSLDPYMRGRMRDPKIKSYNEAFELHQPLQTLAVGEVVRSDVEDIKIGETFRGMMPFSEWAVVPKEQVKFGKVLQGEFQGLPATTLVGAAGMPGATAWVGLYDIGRPKRGETIFVSAASGAVGQVVVQLAKREGLTVIGSAGSEEKVKHLRELGVDIAFNYKTESTLEVLQQNPPDLYFDNVGGPTLDAVLATIEPKGRIIACGSVSQYNVEGEKYGLKESWQVVTKTIRWEGFIVFQHDQTAFEREFPKMLKSGDIKVREHVTRGIDNGEAFVDMLAGRNHGKAVISLE